MLRLGRGKLLYLGIIRRPRKSAPGLTGGQAATHIPPACDAGAVAQLGERDVRNVEVRGSIPLGSTKKWHATQFNRTMAVLPISERR